MTERKLEGRSAILTGGAKGIGVHYAHALVEAGAKVAILDIEDGQALAEQLCASHGREVVRAFQLDVSDEDQVKTTVGSVVSWAGDVDILVNNAAIFATLGDVKVTDMDVALWDKVMAVNVRGPFLMVKHVAPLMIAKGRGKIVNISSGSAYKGLPFMSHYVTSKGAMLGFTRALARELGAHNLNINTLAPGLILSDSISANQEHLDTNRDRVVASRALKRDGYPNDLLGGLIFLCSADSDFMTGQTMLIDGGSVNI
jgi:NAD(P)-dependent dehydrogenase (short-subunit alcohol dehydrogenase family)